MPNARVRYVSSQHPPDIVIISACYDEAAPGITFASRIFPQGGCLRERGPSPRKPWAHITTLSRFRLRQKDLQYRYRAPPQHTEPIGRFFLYRKDLVT